MHDPIKTEYGFVLVQSRRLRRPLPITDLQTAINTYLAEHNANPRTSGPNPPTLSWPNSTDVLYQMTDVLYQMFESVH